MADRDKPVDLEFPLGGMEQDREFQEQSPGTTPLAVNTRGINPDSLRNRGGSRAGLGRYIPTVVPASAASSLLIQHLAVIVDPQATALHQNFTVPGSDWVADPLNPGTFVPPGGWGVQPNPNASQPAQEGGGASISFVQSEYVIFDYDVSGAQSGQFTSNPTSGNFLIIWVYTVDATANRTVAPTNFNGNTYIQIGSYQRQTVNSQEYSMSAWYRVAADGADERTVIVTPSGNVDISVIAQEFRGQNSSPIGNTVTSSGSGVAPATGTLTIATTGNAALVGFLVTNGEGDGGFSTFDSDYTTDFSTGGGVEDGDPTKDGSLLVAYKLNCTAGTEDAAGTVFASDAYVSLAIELKD